MPKPTQALAILSATVAVSLVAACGNSSNTIASEEKVTLTFVAYGGSGQQAMIDKYQKPYTAAHPNVTFVNTSPPDVSQVKTQVESKSVKWDLISLNPAIATQNCGTLYEPLDFSGIDSKDLVDGTIGKCYLGNFINSTPFAYRTDAFPDPSKAPKTIADFFDIKKFPNKRGMANSIQNGILEYALLGDGVASKDLYPLDVDRALKKLSTIRSVTTIAPNLAALEQVVVTKQVDMFLLTSSRLVPVMDGGLNATIVWDKTMGSLNGFAVPKGSSKVKAAQQFMATMLKPDVMAGLCEILGTVPTNKQAKPNLTPTAQKVQIYGPANTGETVFQNVEWWSHNIDGATAKLNKWVASG